jgi:hypothetical protein
VYESRYFLPSPVLLELIANYLAYIGEIYQSLIPEKTLRRHLRSFRPCSISAGVEIDDH